MSTPGFDPSAKSSKLISDAQESLFYATSCALLTTAVWMRGSLKGKLLIIVGVMWMVFTIHLAYKSGKINLVDSEYQDQGLYGSLEVLRNGLYSTVPIVLRLVFSLWLEFRGRGSLTYQCTEPRSFSRLLLVGLLVVMGVSRLALVYSELRLELMLKPGLGKFFKEYECGKDVSFAVDYFRTARFTENSQWVFEVSKLVTSLTCTALMIRNSSLRLTKIVEWPFMAHCSLLYLTASTFDLLSFRGYNTDMLRTRSLIVLGLVMYWSHCVRARPEPLKPTEEKPKNNPQAQQTNTSAPVKRDSPEEPNASTAQDYDKEDSSFLQESKPQRKASSASQKLQP
ncbi:hypothetical protein PQX77_001611 [Marasmius sp. AFHP31]|nr:hypothetical protein PQX77_001611 [Marasmius sp. AFHP31]